MKDEKYYEMYANAYDYEERRETGKRIKQACREAGFKLVDIALSLGIDPKSFYKIISGEVECKTKYLYEISQLTGRSTDYFLFGNEKSEGLEDIVSICQDISVKDMKRVKKILVAFLDQS